MRVCHVLTVLLFATIVTTSGEASTNCSQQFTFLACTAGPTPTLWIAEDLAGECHYSRLLQFSVAPEGASLAVSDFAELGDWQWLAAALEEHFVTVETEPLVEKEGRWSVPGGDWAVAAPEPDPDALAGFVTYINEGGSDAVGWNTRHGRAGRSLPHLYNAPAELLGAYDRGLYINYTISSGLFVPRYGLVLLFTHQEQCAVGLDTMHGVLVLRLKPDVR